MVGLVLVVALVIPCLAVFYQGAYFGIFCPAGGLETRRFYHRYRRFFE